MEDKKQQLQLDSGRLFDQIDVHRLGYLSLNNFANWIAENCGFQVKSEDLIALQRALDRNNDYRIMREEFIESVSPPADEEEEEEGDKE